jgi:hypothetical protein
MEERAIRDAYDLYKEALQVEFKGDGYWHVAPPECRQDLRCVYDLLFRINAPAVSPIAERFLEYAHSQQLSPGSLAQVVVSYVQAIEYSRVTDDPYGLVPPAVVVNSFGDCDSKALLAVMLLRMVGIDAVIVSSDLARHAMLGVDSRGGRDRLRHLGRTYAFVEITAPRWPIGHVPPRYRTYRDWRVVPFATPVWTHSPNK